MLASITVLLLFQLCGEVLVRSAGVPVPGPVAGMLLLFLALLMRGTIPQGLRSTTQGLLEHLSLLFVPAGVGVMVHFGRLSGEIAAIAVALLVSTLLAVMATALTMRAVMHWTKRDGKEKG